MTRFTAILIRFTDDNSVRRCSDAWTTLALKKDKGTKVEQKKLEIYPAQQSFLDAGKTIEGNVIRSVYRKAPIMTSRHVSLRSAHGPVECAQRLNAEMNQYNQPGVRMIAGHADESYLKMMCRTGEMRNSFVPIFEGKLKYDRGGTLIKGKFGMSRFVIIFMIGWFGFLAFFLFTSITLFDLPDETDFWFSLPFIVMPILMAFAGVGILLHGRRIAKNDRKVMLDFLAKTLDAKPDQPAYKIY